MNMLKCGSWFINYDKTKNLIFGMRNDDHFSFKMGERKISICEEFKFSLKVEVAAKQENIIMIKPKRLCTFYIKEFEIFKKSSN